MGLQELDKGFWGFEEELLGEGSFKERPEGAGMGWGERKRTKLIVEKDLGMMGAWETREWGVEEDRGEGIYLSSWPCQ